MFAFKRALAESRRVALFIALAFSGFVGVTHAAPLVVGVVEQVDAKTGSIVVLGQPYSVGKAVLFAGRKTHAVGFPVSLLKTDILVRVDGEVLANTSVRVTSVTVLPESVVPGANELFVAGVVKSVDLCGGVTVGGLTVDLTGTFSEGVPVLAVGDYVEVTGIQPVARGVLYAQGLVTAGVGGTGATTQGVGGTGKVFGLAGELTLGVGGTGGPNALTLGVGGTGKAGTLGVGGTGQASASTLGVGGTGKVSIAGATTSGVGGTGKPNALTLGVGGTGKASTLGVGGTGQARASTLGVGGTGKAGTLGVGGTGKVSIAGATTSGVGGTGKPNALTLGVGGTGKASTLGVGGTGQARASTLGVGGTGKAGTLGVGGTGQS